MIGHADDTLVFCLAAAALVVLAHGTDALGSRRSDPDKDGWGHTFALAFCGLAVAVLIVGALMSKSTTDLMVTLATCAAVAVSALPLLGFGFGDGTRERPPNPWDRAYRVRPGRVAQLLSPMSSPKPKPEPRASTAPPVTSHGIREGVIVPQSTHPATPGMGPTGAPTSPTTSSSPRTQSPSMRTQPQPAADVSSTPEVYEAEETLHDVTQVVGDLGRLLGLDQRGRPPGQTG